MILEVLSFLRALPRIAEAVERIDARMTEREAQQRKDAKDELVTESIAAARANRDERVRDEQVPGLGGNNDGSSEGV